MSMNRAYSVLSVKALDDGARRFSGIATTPSVDRDGDIIDPLGAQFAAELPLLWQHRSDQPVGRVKFGKPNKGGIDFEAEIPEVEEAGELRSLVDKAWQSIKYGLVRAVSIGFRTIAFERLEAGGLLIKSWECLELSVVTIPANSEAIITAVKSLDLEGLRRADPEIQKKAAPAAMGKLARVVRLEEPARDRAPFVINSIWRNGQ